MTLTDAHLTSLAAGSLAVVRVPEFLPRIECERIVARLSAVPLDSYDAHRVDPPIVKFGPVLNDHRTSECLAEVYWGRADVARIAWRRARLRPDPLSWSLKCIGEA